MKCSGAGFCLVSINIDSSIMRRDRNERNYCRLSELCTNNNLRRLQDQETRGVFFFLLLLPANTCLRYIQLSD